MSNRYVIFPDGSLVKEEDACLDISEFEKRYNMTPEQVIQYRKMLKEEYTHE